MYLQGHTKHRQEGGIIAFIIALKILLQTVVQVHPHTAEMTKHLCTVHFNLSHDEGKSRSS